MKAPPAHASQKAAAPKPGSEADALVRFVRSELTALANPDTARAMAAYMKTTQPFYGVMNTPRRELMQRVWRRFPPADAAAWSDAVTALFAAGKGGDSPGENTVPPRRDSQMRPPRWHGQREFFYTACAYAERGKPFHNSAALPMFKRMIAQSGWWDIVDWIAGKMIGGQGRAFDADPARVCEAMESWIDDGNLWVRRSAIICQLHRKGRTDTRMLERFCLARAHEKDFFIRKAIGWALRQHARTDPRWVSAFLARHGARLSTLSVREASKHL